MRHARSSFSDKHKVLESVAIDIGPFDGAKPPRGQIGIDPVHRERLLPMRRHGDSRECRAQE
jgi:hypothetical protein